MAAPGPSFLSESFDHVLPAEMSIPRQSMEILYEDDHYIVFDKPPGLLVVPTPKNESKTLVNIVNRLYTSAGHPRQLYPCHRIDRETSGAVIFAKGRRCQRLMMDLFKKRAVVKKYIAFVHGTLRPGRGEFRRPVKDVHRQKFRRARPPAPALTRYKVLKTARRFSVVGVRPVTGRTNQIRIHFSQAGHPLVGERTYAFARDYALKFRRTALHAALLEWVHPVSRKRIHVESALPKDMRDFLANHKIMHCF